MNNIEAFGNVWAFTGNCNHKLIKDGPAYA